ncbi:MAG: helix-turn-helix transcriptional regulator [Desulfuromonadales bacterium]|nr:helix-turn-helix transcriptional regulator [Desulfuromonadales bacterium]MDW7758706.1 helix-turn-helix transcriptional regulator [Desulfuromonadales bacterium]
MTLGERLKKVRGGVSRDKFAPDTGISKTALVNYESDSRSPNADYLIKVLEVCPEYSPQWLLTGEGPMLRAEAESTCLHADGCLNGDFLLVPHYNVSASAGGGAIIESEQVVDHLAFKRKWVREMGLQADRLALINAIGDSMRPTIQEGNLLLVDLNQLHVQDGAIYILMMNSTLIAKRLQRNIDGGIIVKSDNKDYSDLFVGPKDLGQLNIVGKVVWAGRKM